MTSWHEDESPHKRRGHPRLGTPYLRAVELARIETEKESARAPRFVIAFQAVRTRVGLVRQTREEQ